MSTTIEQLLYSSAALFLWVALGALQLVCVEQVLKRGAKRFWRRNICRPVLRAVIEPTMVAAMILKPMVSVLMVFESMTCFSIGVF